MLSLYGGPIVTMLSVVAGCLCFYIALVAAGKVRGAFLLLTAHNLLVAIRRTTQGMVDEGMIVDTGLFRWLRGYDMLAIISALMIGALVLVAVEFKRQRGSAKWLKTQLRHSQPS